MDALAKKLKPNFPLLSNPGNAYARGLDLVFAVEPAVRDVYRAKGLDLSKYNGDESWELPVTAVFVCDEDRRILYAWTESDYTRRPDNYKNVDEAFRIVEQLDKKKFEIWFIIEDRKSVV